MAMADKEIGSVLIAINSYVNPRTHLEPLLNIDQAFADYIAAFYSRLFFHVEVLVDFSFQDLDLKLKFFAQNSVGSRIAAVFLCHGGLNSSGAECIYTNDAHPVPVVKILDFFHRNCRDKNKYLFFDACRSDTSGDKSTPRLVYKASVDKTFVVFSTLPFHKAYVSGSYSSWSYWFTQKIINHMVLYDVVASVDDVIREQLKISHEGQVSEVSVLGAVENPNLRAIAAAENQSRIRGLSVELGLFITQMWEIMTECRQNLSAVPVATTLREPIGTSLASSLPQDPDWDKICALAPFNREAFMDKYMDRFMKCVPAETVALKWELHSIINPDTTTEIKRALPSQQCGILFKYIRTHGSLDAIRKMCDFMIETGKRGYPNMKALGEEMKEDLKQYR